MSMREVIARCLLGKSFFNSDASREIDRLAKENEHLREELVKVGKILEGGE